MSHPASEAQLPSPASDRLDPAQQSLADALKTSFLILKVAMAVMVVTYLFSGIFTVKPGEKAVRLFLGEVVTDAARAPREYEPGTYWGWPFPIERVVRVPAEAHEVKVDSAFLPHLSEDEKKGFGGLKGPELSAIAAKHPSLDPTKDGSLITADANLVHMACAAKWRVRGLKAFLTAVGDQKKGDLLVRAALERGMVHTAAKTTADQALGGAKELGAVIRESAQGALPADCGIEITEAEIMPDLTFAPLPTRAAFASVSTARSEQAKLMDDAKQYADRVLGDAAGDAQDALHGLISLEELATLREGSDGALTAALRRELALSFEKLACAGKTVEDPSEAYAKAVAAGDADLSAPRAALLAALAQAADPAFVRTGPAISGATRTKMAEAEAYRATTVQALRAEAHAFEVQLEQYKANPLIFTTRRWQAMREKVFTSPTVETFFVPTERLSIETGRDPETAGKVDTVLLSERKKKAGVE